MKKVLLVIILVLLSIACTENTYESWKPISVPISVNLVSVPTPTIRKLQSFNDSLFVVANYSATRGGGFWKVLAVASADYLAAATAFRTSIGVAAWITAVSGGTAGPLTGVAVLTVTGAIAAGASYGAASGIYSVPIPFDRLSINDIFGTSAVYEYLYDYESYYEVHDLSTFSLNVNEMGEVLGDIHNDIVSELLECKHSYTRDVGPINSERIEFVQATIESAGMMLEDIENAYVIGVSNFVNLFQKGDYIDYIDIVHKDGLMSDEVTDILMLLNEALTYGTIDCSSANNAIDFYIGTIEKSIDLGEEDRTILILTLNIAKKSISLWNSILN